MSAAVRSLPPDPEQLRELQLLCREYESRIRASDDPRESQRLRAIKELIEACIKDMKKRLES